MRPSEHAFGRSRAADAGNTPSPFPSHNASSPQMAFFLADEAAVDAHLEQQPTRPSDSRKHQASSGRPDVASMTSPAMTPNMAAAERPVTDNAADVEQQQQQSPFLPDSRPATPSYKSLGTPASHAQPSLSQPMTPIMLGISGPASALSSSSSRRNSLDGSLSDGIGSGAQSIAGEAHLAQSSVMMDSGSAPQLIMPSIRMPSRRPFTDEGKRMGRLKILFAGGSGVGKTSLIKAIVQSCVHIVHVDPISAPKVSLRAGSSSRAKTTRSSGSSPPTGQITEIYASTKPYPEWWTDLDDIRILRRRKSLGDSILDRNISFVDTPGYGGGSSSMEIITPVVNYIESQMERLCSSSVGDQDLLNLLSGGGGSQVDVVFYLVPDQLKPVDLHYLKLLAPLTNVIPLLARADTMSSEQVALSKEQISSQLREADIRPFDFSLSPGMAARAAGAASPYSISSAPGSDHETMDASLLMSSDYVQPLIPSELSVLVDQVFSEDGTSWLRHSAARKFLQWRRSGPAVSRPPSLYRPLSSPVVPGITAAAAGTGNVSPGGTASGTASMALARITDHTQREQQLAQIRLANWAAELQRSLANERARYEALARNERAVWLTEKLGECVQDGTLVPVPARGRSNSGIRGDMRRVMGRGPSSKALPHQDPLGLLEIAAKLRARGWLALEVVGSLGVIGGLAFWVTKHFSHIQVFEWLVNEWGSFWNGER